ncbi:Choline-sulfatase [Mucinivorans hirudinis]|uniref:Choline-sulfatase n=1 Tax=Mucinivorans hirudinis TaxID=1433126 RepID=A0A060RCU9_9BACT|nr:Choline-sulfatase [Mucinivorans hirudinis]
MKRQIALTALASLAALSATAQQKPINVIFILTDDLGIGDVGVYGQRTIKTPNIDSLARSGIQFMQHYSGSTVSAPSRCVMLTGKHTGHSNIRGNFVDPQPGTTYDRSLGAEEVTVAQIFKQAGYTTGITGKWGLGRVAPNDSGNPHRKGFDYFFGFETHIDAHRAYPSHLWENDKRIELGGQVYGDELIVQKSLEFIEKNSEKPFFLYLATTLPHADILVPEQEMKPFDDGRFLEKPHKGGYAAQPKPRATFAAMVTRIDNTVGRVAKLLKEKGIADNTLIIFTSDNGTHMEGGHDPYYFWSNSGYRGTKRDLYEGGIRTPFIASCPALIRPGAVSYHVSAFWDFMPTVCELTNQPLPDNTDGISYLPTLAGRGEQHLHNYLYWEFHEQGGKQAVLKDNWKLIRLNVFDKSQTRYELYNLGSDPKELRNVAGEFAWKVEELKQVMDSANTPNNIWYFQQ